MTQSKDAPVSSSSQKTPLASWGSRWRRPHAPRHELRSSGRGWRRLGRRRLVLAFVGWVLVRESKGLLIGEQASSELSQSILALAESQEGVDGVNGVVATHLAPDQIVVTLSLEFSDELRTPEIEEAVQSLEERIRAKHPEVIALFVEPQSRFRLQGSRACAPPQHRVYENCEGGLSEAVGSKSVTATCRRETRAAPLFARSISQPRPHSGICEILAFPSRPCRCDPIGHGSSPGRVGRPQCSRPRQKTPRRLRPSGSAGAFDL